MAGAGSLTACASSPARCGRSRSRSMVRRRYGSARAASVRSRSNAGNDVNGLAELELEAGSLRHVFSRDDAEGLAEGPHVALGVFTEVGAVAVELVFRLSDDLGAGGPGAGAMGVDVLGELDVDSLSVPAADAGGALDVLG